MKLTPLKIGTALVGAVAAAEQIVPLLPPQYAAPVRIALPFIALIAGLLAPQVRVKRALPDSDKGPDIPRPTGKGKIPPIPPPLLLLALLVFAGCGGNARPDVADARKVTKSAFDCVDSASEADELEPALFACGVETLRVVSVLCSSGVIPRGEFCDRVGVLVQ